MRVHVQLETIKDPDSGLVMALFTWASSDAVHHNCGIANRAWRGVDGKLYAKSWDDEIDGASLELRRQEIEREENMKIDVAIRSQQIHI